MDKEQLTDILDTTMPEIFEALEPILAKIEDQFGPEANINVTMNVGAIILAEGLGRLKNKDHRRVALIGHAKTIAHNMEVSLAGNEADALIDRVKEGAKT
jgi:hypothetical protein